MVVRLPTMHPKLARRGSQRRHTSVMRGVGWLVGSTSVHVTMRTRVFPRDVQLLYRYYLATAVFPPRPDRPRTLTIGPSRHPMRNHRRARYRPPKIPRKGNPKRYSQKWVSVKPYFLYTIPFWGPGRGDAGWVLRVPFACTVRGGCAQTVPRVCSLLLRYQDYTLHYLSSPLVVEREFYLHHARKGEGARSVRVGVAQSRTQ